MICPECFGRRLASATGVVLPCPECGGTGTVHCCEGLQAQPECAEPSEGGTCCGESCRTHILPQL